MNIPLIYAHRGASGDVIEMTMEAYEVAVDQLADGFECDVRLTRDRELVLWHDSDLSRVAHSSVVVANSSKAELLQVFPILSPNDLLDFALKHKKNIAFETKHPVPTRGAVENALVELLDSRREEIVDAGIQISVMSFSWWAVRKIKTSQWPAVTLVFNKRGLTFARSEIVALEVTQVREDANLVRRLQSRGKRVYVWTVNTPADAKLMREANVDAIITDYPGRIREALR